MKQYDKPMNFIIGSHCPLCTFTQQIPKLYQDKGSTILLNFQFFENLWFIKTNCK